MSARYLLSWKPWFYDVFLPVVRTLGPFWGEGLLSGLGLFVGTVWPPRQAELYQALARTRARLGADWDLTATLKLMEGNVLRFLARETLLDGLSDAAFQDRFDVHGFDHLQEARDRGRGVILVGCHLGAHLSAPHWLYRQGVPLRQLIQRPQHVSQRLNAEFDRTDGPHPQAGFFLRRNLEPEEASKRIFRTRAALRDGYLIYVKGDVPWVGPNTRPATFLGYERTFQSLWAELAALFRAPVVPVFCTHLPRGRYRLTFDPGWSVPRDGEGDAVVRYLTRLEAEILAHPADAAAHLLWPCYGPPEAEPRPVVEAHDPGEAAGPHAVRPRSRRRSHPAA